MNKIPLIDLPLQYQRLKKEIDPVIKRIIKNGDFILGEDLRMFEREFARYCGAKYCCGLSSGSTALDLALKAIGIKTGDQVICPTLTFTASAAAIANLGAIPVFIDTNPITYNLDKNQIAKKITKKTKAIIVVHLYGQITDMDEIGEIAKKYKLKIIEDAAQAHGATDKNKKTGFWGDIACLSFYPSKNLGCFGDGGAIVTNSSKIAKTIFLLRDHGRTSKYSHKLVGYNGRLDNLQAAILRIKLKYLDIWNENRRQIARYYNSNLSSIYTIPQTFPKSKHVYYTYTLAHKKRNLIISMLASNGISSAIYYPIPLHLQEAYSNLEYRKKDLPVAENICKNIFSIPIYPEMTEKQIHHVVTVLNKIANNIKNA